MLNNIRDKIVSIGRLRTVVLITIFSILASLLITFIISITTSFQPDLIGMSITIISPAVIAPIVSWFIVGLVINIHHLEAQMRELATYDVLTGAMSRGAFLEACQNILHYSQRNHMSLAALYLDIDDFKSINDTYGHAGGDAVLTAFSDAIKHDKRKSDLFGRMGGEEFILMLPNTGLEGAILFANKLRESLKDTAVSYLDASIQYTVSIGVAVSDSQNQNSVEQLIKHADNALYAAKHSGKDRVLAL